MRAERTRNARYPYTRYPSEPVRHRAAHAAMTLVAALGTTAHRSVLTQAGARRWLASAGDGFVIGARDANRPQYTDTGATGRDSTRMSASLDEARAGVRALYRDCVEHVPQMRKDFNLSENRHTLVAVIKDMFLRNRDIGDPKLIDVLVFKGRQELNEVTAQWKSRHHVVQYVHQYEERVHRRDAEAALRAVKQAEGGDGDDEARAASASPALEDELDTRRLRKLHEWRRKKLVPEWVHTWQQYTKWRMEEEEKFAAFATSSGMFTDDELAANRHYIESHSNCRMM